MEKILNFEDFQNKLRVDAETEVATDALEAQQAVIEFEENEDLQKQLDEISETELPEIFVDYEIVNEENEEFKVTEPAMSGNDITLKINGQKYKFAGKPEDDIKEIFRKFQKMMSFAKAGGKALAWLHKQVGKGEKIA